MILVFKTSISTKKKAKRVKPYLDKLLSGEKWNFDLEDCDNILRIDSKGDVSKLVVGELNNLGYECVELE
ncbi:hypothetical protein AHMF7605_01480 [Adhaeribacter arboris]|uniref:Uncharacterized protein n=1 Tax=Adhaeribacter arboris TaxID=2072846 RepID=A0A2T2Y9U2_9BACT|nr:hypothetical protein [Adhaeribacter arboris]PSR52284.1 hypothetical protein AHMF7605_01480 [Adhaeribacter arboris]